MKKKLAMLVLATSMVLSACGAKADADTETSVEVEAEAEEEAEEEEVEEDDEVEEADVEETEAEEAEVEEEETEAEVEEEEAEVEETEDGTGFAKGFVTEAGWESEWMGIRFTCPEGVTMSTEEELNEVMGLGQEALSEDFSEAQLKYAELSTVYEMMCTDELGVTNVIVSAEKLPMTITAEQYIEAVEQQLSAVSAVSYETVSNDEVVTIGDVDFTKLECKADYEGVSMYQNYFVTIKDDRAFTIIMTYIDETAETADAIMNGFAAY